MVIIQRAEIFSDYLTHIFTLLQEIRSLMILKIISLMIVTLIFINLYVFILLFRVASCLNYQFMTMMIYLETILQELLILIQKIDFFPTNGNLININLQKRETCFTKLINCPREKLNSGLILMLRQIMVQINSVMNGILNLNQNKSLK